MHRACLLILAAAPILAAPAVANTSAEAAFSRDPNGAFLFKNYPSRALAAGEQGKVGFRVTLDKKGQLTSCDVTESSGYARLDEETCALIVRHAVFKPVRDVEGRMSLATHEGYVNWKLPEGRGAQPAPMRTAAAAPDKVICKRQVRTGSLVGTNKICMTKREWTLAADRAQEDYGAIQGRGAAWDATAEVPGGL